MIYHATYYITFGKKIMCQSHINYCGMYIPLNDDKHQFVRDNSKKYTGNLRQNSV